MTGTGWKRLFSPTAADQFGGSGVFNFRCAQWRVSCSRLTILAVLITGGWRSTPSGFIETPGWFQKNFIVYISHGAAIYSQIGLVWYCSSPGGFHWRRASASLNVAICFAESRTGDLVVPIYCQSRTEDFSYQDDHRSSLACPMFASSFGSRLFSSSFVLWRHSFAPFIMVVAKAASLYLHSVTVIFYMRLRSWSQNVRPSNSSTARSLIISSAIRSTCI